MTILLVPRSNIRGIAVLRGRSYRVFGSTGRWDALLPMSDTVGDHWLAGRSAQPVNRPRYGRLVVSLWADTSRAYRESRDVPMQVTGAPGDVQRYHRSGGMDLGDQSLELRILDRRSSLFMNHVRGGVIGGSGYNFQDAWLETEGSLQGSRSMAELARREGGSCLARGSSVGCSG